MHCDLLDFIPVVFGRPIIYLLALADLFLRYCCVADVKMGMKVVLCTVTCQIFFLLALADLFLKYCYVSDVRHGMKVVVCTVTCQIMLLLITLLLISCCFDFYSLYK